MFVCTIELLYPSKREDEEPGFYTVGKHYFDPGFREGDKFEINSWQVWGKDYTFNVLVIEHKYEVYPPDRRLVSRLGYPDIAAEEGIINLRIFVEAEDREQLLELHEAIEKNNSR